MMKHYIAPGEQARVKLPWSEVCMHMKVAGKAMTVELTANGMAQLKNDDGSDFSFPILAGEAGLYSDSNGIYYVTEEPRIYVLITPEWDRGGTGHGDISYSDADPGL